jgi:hypothetical protein
MEDSLGNDEFERPSRLEGSQHHPLLAHKGPKADAQMSPMNGHSVVLVAPNLDPGSGQ